MKNYTSQLFLECSHLCFDLFLPRFRFSLNTFIKFFIYSRLLHFNLGWDFSYNCNFSVYRVEISTRDENLHIISPLETINHQWFNEIFLNDRSNSLGMLVNFVATPPTFSNDKSILAAGQNAMRSAKHYKYDQQFPNKVFNSYRFSKYQY